MQIKNVLKKWRQNGPGRADLNYGRAGPRFLAGGRAEKSRPFSNTDLQYKQAHICPVTTVVTHSILCIFKWIFKKNIIYRFTDFYRLPIEKKSVITDYRFTDQATGSHL